MTDLSEAIDKSAMLFGVGVERARAVGARSRSTTPSGARRRPEPVTPAERVLQLQRQAGNQAVVRLLGQETPSRSGPLPNLHSSYLQRQKSTPEYAPVTTLQPGGTLSEAQWTAAHRAARAKPTVAAYEPLFRDIAVTAGMTALGASFVPATIPTTDGKTAEPGLNMTLDTSGHPGHVGWIDNRTGEFGVPLRLQPDKAPDVSVGMILTPGALKADKGLSLTTTRHEMVHAKHKFMVLAAAEAWRKVPGPRRPSFDSWLASQAKKRSKPMTALEVALISRGARNGAANTEVLAYVEGFVNDYHRRPAVQEVAGPAFFELLGVVETEKLHTWKQADSAVQAEALTRLREYHATLDPAHQRLWKQWLDRQLPNLAKDTTGRKDFLTRLSAFVI